MSDCANGSFAEPRWERSNMRAGSSPSTDPMTRLQRNRNNLEEKPSKCQSDQPCVSLRPAVSEEGALTAAPSHASNAGLHLQRLQSPVLSQVSPGCLYPMW